MTKKQQEETLDYFQSHAEDWHTKATGQNKKKVNVIQQRNGYVLQVIKERSDNGLVLDVGCGTGDLVCDIAREQVDAVGVDFAQDMIDISVEKASENQLGNASFECCSIFDFDFSSRQFDVISANGFIEYISFEEMDRFYDIVYDALPEGGSFIVGSRNRLFNLFSLNAFTLQELKDDNVEGLLNEAIHLASGDRFDDISEVEIVPIQDPDQKHEKTGIGVTTRFQYTPLQLVKMLSEKGFKPVEVYPVHIHSVPPQFKQKFPELHTAVANTLQKNCRNHLELLPTSSTFMLHLKKV